MLLVLNQSKPCTPVYLVFKTKTIPDTQIISALEFCPSNILEQLWFLYPKLSSGCCKKHVIMLEQCSIVSLSRYHHHYHSYLILLV